MVRCPSIVRPPLKIFSKTAGQSQISYGVSVGWGNKSLFAGLGHMTKMATTPIYGKNPSKIFFSRTKWPVSCGLVCSIGALGPIIVCSNDGPRLTLTYFMTRSNLISYFYMGKTVKKSFNGRNLQQMTRVTKGLCLYKNSDPMALSAPALGLYTCLKTWKITYKIRLQRYFFETCNKWAKWQGFSVDICLCPGAI